MVGVSAGGGGALLALGRTNGGVRPTDDSSGLITAVPTAAHATDQNSAEIVERLRVVTQWEFDVFEFAQRCDQRPLAFIMYELFARFGFFEAMSSEWRCRHLGSWY